jgi:hypothetical protein
VPVVTEWVGAQYRSHLPAASCGVLALGAATGYALLVPTAIRADSTKPAPNMAGSDHKTIVTIMMYAAGGSLRAGVHGKPSPSASLAYGLVRCLANVVGGG